jgi:nucleoside-diphosphate-sugar epimerase
LVNVIGTLNCLEAARHEGVERFRLRLVRRAGR